MKIIIETVKLQEAIAKCESIINYKSKNYNINELIKNINIKIKDNKITFTACNENANNYITCIYELPELPQVENIEFTLQDTEKFCNTIKCLDCITNSIITSLEIEENNCTIICGAKTIKIDIIIQEYNNEESIFPKVPELNNDNKKEYKCKAKDFTRLTDYVKYAIIKDKSRPLIENICFNNNEIVALDGRRLVKNTNKILNIERQFILDTSILSIIKKIFLKDQSLIIKEDTQNIFIECGNCIIISKLNFNEFIAYDKVIPLNAITLSMEVNIKDMIKQLKYIYSFTNGEHKEISIIGDQIIVNNGEIKQETKITTKFIDTKLKEEEFFKVKVNCKYMLEALQNFKSKTATLSLTAPAKPIYIKSIEDDCENLVLILPLRPY